jgi:hypothetical protein
MDEYLSQQALDSLLIFSHNPELRIVVILKWTQKLQLGNSLYCVSFPKYVKLP